MDHPALFTGTLQRQLQNMYIITLDIARIQNLSRAFSSVKSLLQPETEWLLVLSKRSTYWYPDQQWTNCTKKTVHVLSLN